MVDWKSPLRPPADEVEPNLPSGEARLFQPGAEEPSNGELEVPRKAHFVQPYEAGTDSVAGLTLGPARGGKKPRKKAVMWEVLRSLRLPEDLPLLSQSLPAPARTLNQIRHSHHQLAQLLSEGKPQGEAGLLTGYSPAYISVLKDDPSFQELIAYYSAQQELVFVDVMERMRTLGLSTMDVLQERLETDPDGFTNRELMEQTELMLVKPMVASRGALSPSSSAIGSGTGSGVSVNVNFIQSAAPHPQPEDILKPPQVIDLKAEEV